MAPTDAAMMRLRTALRNVAINPEAFNDRWSPQTRALRFLYDTVVSAGSGGGSTLTLNQLLSNQIRLRQRFALLTLDLGLQHERAQQSQFNASTAIALGRECTMRGVNCTNDQVTSIVWHDENLRGYIPEEIGLLTSLTYLDLGENSIQGTLPNGLFSCTALDNLILHSNRLNGTIPQEFSQLSNLFKLFLGDNQLTGTIPTEIGSPRLGIDGVRPLRK